MFRRNGIPLDTEEDYWRFIHGVFSVPLCLCGEIF